MTDEGWIDANNTRNYKEYGLELKNLNPFFIRGNEELEQHAEEFTRKYIEDNFYTAIDHIYDYEEPSYPDFDD